MTKIFHLTSGEALSDLTGKTRKSFYLTNDFFGAYPFYDEILERNSAISSFY